MNKRFLFSCSIMWLLYSAVFCFSLHAQVVNEKRIEIAQKEGFENFNAIPFGEEGILLYSREKEGSYWLVEKYDKDLVREKEIKLSVPKNYSLSKHFESESELVILFTNTQGEFELYIITVGELSARKKVGEFPVKKLSVKELVASDKLALVSGGSKNGPVIMTIDKASGKSAIIPTVISPYSLKDLSIENTQVLPTGEMMIYINARDRKELSVFVLHLNESGKRDNLFNLSAKTEKLLTSVSASPLANDEFMFTGTYSSKSVSTSEGMYIAKTTGDDIDFMKFYNFLDFEEFLSYLPEAKQEKIEKKKEKSEGDDKEYTINYFIAEHEILETEDGYIFIGEAYYPTYTYQTTTTFVNGKAQTTRTRVFDGYYYTHATIVGFDIVGEKLWDRTFELSPDYKPYSIKRFISVSINDDVINLLFASGNSIRAISFTTDGNEVNELSFDYIKEETGGEVVKSSYSNMSHWYDTNFIAHGSQVIKDTDASLGNKKRSVYFIAKINYQ